MMQWRHTENHWVSGQRKPSNEIDRAINTMPRWDQPDNIVGKVGEVAKLPAEEPTPSCGPNTIVNSQHSRRQNVNKPSPRVEQGQAPKWQVNAGWRSIVGAQEVEDRGQGQVSPHTYHRTQQLTTPSSQNKISMLIICLVIIIIALTLSDC